MHQRLQKSTLFPYTTLFRSPDPRAAAGQGVKSAELEGLHRRRKRRRCVDLDHDPAGARPAVDGRRPTGLIDQRAIRSEEHTSELQSLAYLVCRLLLEKKKFH